MMPQRIAEQLDVRINKNGVTELIFWDNLNGNDVCANMDTEGNLSIAGKKVTLLDFIKKVKETATAEKTSSSF
jgi:hypothetical protein